LDGDHTDIVFAIRRYQVFVLFINFESIDST